MFLLNDQFQTKLYALFNCNDEQIAVSIAKMSNYNRNKTHSNNKRTNMLRIRRIKEREQLSEQDEVEESGAGTKTISFNRIESFVR